MRNWYYQSFSGQPKRCLSPPHFRASWPAYLQEPTLVKKKVCIFVQYSVIGRDSCTALLFTLQDCKLLNSRLEYKRDCLLTRGMHCLLLSVKLLARGQQPAAQAGKLIFTTQPGHLC